MGWLGMPENPTGGCVEMTLLVFVHVFFKSFSMILPLKCFVCFVLMSQKTTQWSLVASGAKHQMFGLGRGRSFAGYGLRTPDAIYPQEAPGGREGAVRCAEFRDVDGGCCQIIPF